MRIIKDCDTPINDQEAEYTSISKELGDAKVCINNAVLRIYTTVDIDISPDLIDHLKETETTLTLDEGEKHVVICKNN